MSQSSVAIKVQIFLCVCVCLFYFFVCVPKINAQLYFKPVVDCPGELSPVVDFPMTQKQVPII